MNKTLLALILAIITTIAFAAASEDLSEITAAQEIQTKISISSEINFVEEERGMQVFEAIAELHNYPREYSNQRIESMTTTPYAEDKKDYLRFRWRNPQARTLAYQLTSTVTTQNNPIRIRQKIQYPLQNELARGYDIFIKPTKNIDSDDAEVQRKAKEILQGEDDLYKAVSKTASWVNTNIEYKITEQTLNTTQTASWALKNKEGACDEIITLFIALLRASGIPARFISGIAYGNAPDKREEWGQHGWAEVYYPELGWIPYDVTFGEYGWIDPSHIKLKETLDPRDQPTKYQWKGINAGITTKPLTIKTELLGIKSTKEPEVEIKTYTAKQKTGSDSYNLVFAEITNLKDYYVTRDLRLANVKEITVLGEKKKTITLAPNEKQKVYWVILTKPITGDYEYEIPIEAYTILDEKGRADFKTRKEYPVYEYTEIMKIKEEIENGKTIAQINEETSAAEEPADIYESEPLQEEIEPEIQEEQNIIQKIIKWIKTLF